MLSWSCRCHVHVTIGWHCVIVHRGTSIISIGSDDCCMLHIARSVCYYRVAFEFRIHIIHISKRWLAVPYLMAARWADIFGRAYTTLKVFVLSFVLVWAEGLPTRMQHIDYGSICGFGLASLQLHGLTVRLHFGVTLTCGRV